MATPLLAQMIEEGFYNNNISEAVLGEYLGDNALSGIDSLVLACTHYPLIKKEIDAYYQGRVKIFDSAEIVARKLKHILGKENLLSSEALHEDQFFVSDYTTSFEEATKIFFQKEVKLERSGIWD
jgi:glutamate racemase